MSLDQPPPLPIDGEGYRFALVAARFNSRFVDGLVENALATLTEAGVDPEDIEVHRVPGSNELPYVVGMLATGREFDCILALGVVMEGETTHADIIAHGTAHAFHQISRETEIPVINGIVTVKTETQAHDRCLGEINRGREFAQAALAMAEAKLGLVKRLDDIYEAEEAQRAAAEKENLGDYFEDGSDGESWKS